MAERDGFELAVPLVPHEKGRFLRLFLLRPGTRERLAKLGCIGEGLSVGRETSDVCVSVGERSGQASSQQRDHRAFHKHTSDAVSLRTKFSVTTMGETGPSP